MTPSRASTLLRSLLGVALLAAFLFALAGRVDLPLVWTYLALLACGAIAAATLLDPALLAERRRPGPGGHDRATVIVEQVLIAAHLVLAGLDLRWRFSLLVPPWLAGVGLGMLAVGGALLLWSMRSNPFFSTVVRVQSERGHVVVRNGPYGWVRHPGYLATMLCLLGGGLALRSVIGLASLVLLVPIVLRRTVIEDRYLLANLCEYESYASSTRYRLLPGVW